MTSPVHCPGGLVVRVDVADARMSQAYCVALDYHTFGGCRIGVIGPQTRSKKTKQKLKLRESMFYTHMVLWGFAEVSGICHVLLRSQYGLWGTPRLYYSWSRRCRFDFDEDSFLRVLRPS